MAQNVVIRDVTYNEVPAVRIPDVNGTAAYFYDTTDATLDGGGKMLNGVTAYAAGVKYTGTIESKSGTDLTAAGDTVTVPAGYYAAQATKAVAAGSAKPPTTISGTSAEVTNGTNTITLQKTRSVTPVVTAGYVSSGTADNVLVSLTANVPTKNATTFTPTTSDQSIAAGTYCVGAQTIKGDAALIGSNIVEGATIFSVAGTAKVPIVNQDSQSKILSIQ